jgi:oligoribonuclease NrnB/cAMP/cGMP phosphodiesterase (DHH superfamily)
MKDLIVKIITEESKRLINESGIRDINKLAKRYPMAKIYFHQDLDGVTTALAMKNYLEQNGIKVVDAEIIQYGGKEFAIHKPEGEGDIMPVLVDFAHGKPMFVIHTDHHDSQAGVEKDTATNFKSSRSNVETISQSISPTDIFSQDDIETISMVDSADFAKHNITPEQVVQYLFKVDRTKGVKENKKMMGLVANKLLLAFKNKPGFLTKLVMNSKPSLQSILLNIKDIMEKEGYASMDQLQQNQQSYIQSRKEKGVTYEDGIISQYGLGPTMKSGGYDRYTPFINHPEAEFLVTGLPMGMVQASCNPYKKERALKGVDLGQIKDEVLEKFRPELEKQRVSFATLKRVSEMDTDQSSVGFTFKDFMAIYGNSPSLKIFGTDKLQRYLDYKSKDLYKSIPFEDRKVFNKASVNGYDVIMANSGGHKCITNISGINYLYTNAKFEDPEKRTRNSYVDLLKDIQAEFVRVLKEKIDQSKNSVNDEEMSLNENSTLLKKKDFKSPSLKTLLENQLLLQEQKLSLPITITDGFQAPKGDADALHSFERRKSDKFGGRMTSKIEAKLKEVYEAGVNPDVVDIKINVDSKEYKVTWSATIDESKDGNAYVGLSTRGSAGGGSDRRAESQVEPLKQQLKKGGAEDITLALDFKNTGGVPIRQYFFKYTIPSKFPAHTTKGDYIRTKEPQITQTGGDQVLNAVKAAGLGLGIGGGGFNFKDIFSSWRNKLVGLSGKTSDTSSVQSSETPTSLSDISVSTGGGNANFKDITKKVIANFEGGYWNPICHGTKGMGKSTETMFGLDRYNGNIESTDKGKQFFKIIDDEKRALGATSSGSGKNTKWNNMDNFCKKWTYNYKGDSRTKQPLMDLATAIMEERFNSNMSSFVKDPKTKQKIMNNKNNSITNF